MTTKIPAHTQVMYDVCDALDEFATTTKGRTQAHTIALKAARLVIDIIPRSAEKAIGAASVARYKAVGSSTKQAPPDEFDQIATQIADAARAAAMNSGGDKAQALKWLQGVLAQVSGQQGGGSGTLGDGEKATKEARWAAGHNALQGQLAGAAGAARAMTQGAQELADALGMNRDPWYR